MGGSGGSWEKFLGVWASGKYTWAVVGVDGRILECMGVWEIYTWEVVGVYGWARTRMGAKDLFLCRLPRKGGAVPMCPDVTFFYLFRGGICSNLIRAQIRSSKKGPQGSRNLKERGGYTVYPVLWQFSSQTRAKAPNS